MLECVGSANNLHLRWRCILEGVCVTLCWKQSGRRCRRRRRYDGLRQPLRACGTAVAPSCNSCGKAGIPPLQETKMHHGAKCSFAIIQIVCEPRSSSATVATRPPPSEPGATPPTPAPSGGSFRAEYSPLIRSQTPFPSRPQTTWACCDPFPRTAACALRHLSCSFFGDRLRRCCRPGRPREFGRPRSASDLSAGSRSSTRRLSSARPQSRSSAYDHVVVVVKQEKGGF